MNISEYLKPLAERANKIEVPQDIESRLTDEQYFARRVKEAVKMVEQEQWGKETLASLMVLHDQLYEVGAAKKAEDERKELEENRKWIEENNWEYPLATTVFTNDELSKSSDIGDILSLIRQEHPDDYEKAQKEAQKKKTKANHSKKYRKKMGGLAILATVSEQKPTPEEEEKWNKLLGQLRLEPTDAESFEDRFEKDFYNRLVKTGEAKKEDFSPEIQKLIDSPTPSSGPKGPKGGKDGR